MNTQEATSAVLSAFDKMIEEAPDTSVKKLESCGLLPREVVGRKWGLGQQTGWPEKYYHAVSNAPVGQEWLAGFEKAKKCVDANGILVLHGKRGNGKTRMAAELAVYVGSSRYRTAMRFFLEVRATYKKRSETTELEVMDELIKAKLLILDEIQERGETAFEDRLLTHVIDARYAAMRPTVLIANLAKSELAESLGASIVDRARENGKSIEFNWTSYRQQS